MSSHKKLPVIGLFFDDNQTNINDVALNCNPYITPILVDASVIDDENYTARMINPPNVNEYAMISYTIPEKSYHTLNDVTMKSIYDWSINPDNASIPKVVIFDWDKTLSVVSGIISLHKYLQSIIKKELQKNPDFTITQQQYFEEYNALENRLLQNSLDYFMGGENRKNKIKDLITSLFNNGTQVYILTNNETAITDRRFFERMLQQLDARLVNNLLCSYNTHKSMVINEKIIPQYLPKNNQSAGKRRNTKRRITKRRNTKRRITKRRITKRRITKRRNKKRRNKKRRNTRKK
jgi:hypothetical protein